VARGPAGRARLGGPDRRRRLEGRDRGARTERGRGARAADSGRVVPPQPRQGRAVRVGVLEARGDPILVSDADLSTPLSEWTKLAEKLPTHPVAIGSRAIEQDLVRKRQSLHRVALGRVGNRLIQLLAVPGIHDTQCGFKLFAAPAARELFRAARVDRFAWDVEILYLARRRGIAIAEVPVLWFNSPESEGPRVRDAVQTLWDVARIRWMHRNGAEDGGR
jgi:dolichyl-phosphate beta-glucosyltransferase